jgi:hypothetical protein
MAAGDLDEAARIGGVRRADDQEHAVPGAAFLTASWRLVVA